MSIKNIGILDLQGDVIEHCNMINRLGHNPVRVKTKGQIEKIDGLIIPGGESTTIGYLMQKYGIDKKIIQKAKMI